MPMNEDGFNEPDNNDRADFANDAVSAYFVRTRPSDPYPEDISALDEDDREALTEALGDMLCDLQHWADVAGIDFDDRLETGRMHYGEEVEDEKRSDLLVTGYEGKGKGYSTRGDAIEGSMTGGAE